MTIIYVYVSIISFCQSECACSLQTVNMAVFLTKKNEINFPKGRALRQMYRVVPQKEKREFKPILYKDISIFVIENNVGHVIKDGLSLKI